MGKIKILSAAAKKLLAAKKARDNAKKAREAVKIWQRIVDLSAS